MAKQYCFRFGSLLELCNFPPIDGFCSLQEECFSLYRLGMLFFHHPGRDTGPLVSGGATAEIRRKKRGHMPWAVSPRSTGCQQSWKQWKVLEVEHLPLWSWVVKLICTVPDLAASVLNNDFRLWPPKIFRHSKTQSTMFAGLARTSMNGASLRQGVHRRSRLDVSVAHSLATCWQTKRTTVPLTGMPVLNC